MDNAFEVGASDIESPVNRETLARDFLEACSLLSASWRHQSYTVAGLSRLIIPPLALGQYVLEPGNLLITYGFFSDEADAGYRSGERKIQPGDWNNGNNAWIIDVVNLGERRELMAAIRKLKQAHPECAVNWRRTKPEGNRRYGQTNTGNGTAALRRSVGR